MTTAFFHASDLPAESRAPAVPRRALNPDLRRLLARKDDRLLHDIGLSREDAMSREDIARADWRRNREIWSL